MAQRPDIPRLIGDLVREGVVQSVDLAAGTCRVAVGDLVTGDIPWLAARAGATRIWSPPAVGEQVAILSPESDTLRAIVIGSLSCDAHPHPASDGSTLIAFADGAILSYDPDAHALTARLPSGSTALVEAETLTIRAAVTIEGDVDLQGKLTARDDVLAAGKSLKGHKHLGVQPGSGVSGVPQ